MDVILASTFTTDAMEAHQVDPVKHSKWLFHIRALTHSLLRGVLPSAK